MSVPALKIYDYIRQKRSIKVVALGASSTQRFLCGMHWFDYIELGFKNYFSHTVGQFINSGVSNDSTVEFLARFDNECAVYQPDLILLTIGANDCRLRHEHKAVENHLCEIISRARAIYADIVFQTFYPIDREASQGNWADLDDYVETVRNVAAAEKIPLVDTAKRWRLLRDSHLDIYRTLLRDFGHLNAKGNMLLGLDLMRFFGVGLFPRDGQIDYCREGILLQYFLDSLHLEKVYGG